MRRIEEEVELNVQPHHIRNSQESGPAYKSKEWEKEINADETDNRIFPIDSNEDLTSSDED